MTNLNFIFATVTTGAIATAALDLWQRLVRVVFGVPATNWAYVGRWFGHMAGGRFLHTAIAASAPVAQERLIGWLVHYAIGIAYAAVYLTLMAQFHAQPGVASALVFGLVTVALPWFVMQPGMGLGVMASKAPRPFTARLHSLSSHAVFGAAWQMAENSDNTLVIATR